MYYINVPPPLATNHLKMLNDEFYKTITIGRDWMLYLLRDNYGDDVSPRRRQIAEFLKNQEINQLYHPSKGKPREI